jgi:ABC-type branched-subunit amino acid transport system substrate-binding protein
LVVATTALAVRARGWSAHENHPAAVPAACVSSRACTEAHGGALHVCRPAGCVPVESVDCKVNAPGETALDPRTLWIGTMFPLTGDNAGTFGIDNTHAAELAVQDFNEVSHGIPSRDVDGVTRPIALVTCDDSVDSRRAAQHLVSLGVHAVVGFGSSKELVDLALTELIPHRMVAVSAINRAAMIRTIPHPTGEPRLVWRATTSVAQAAEPLGALLSDVLEPRVRGQLAGDSRDVRLAVVRGRSPFARSLADVFSRTLRLNGRTLLENSDAFREVSVADDASPREHADAARAVIDFDPDVILYHPSDGGLARPVLGRVERDWPASRRARPHYVVSWELNWAELLDFVGNDADLRRRMLGLGIARVSVAHEQFRTRFAEAHALPKLKRSDAPSGAYDAVYALVYAASVASDGALTGSRIAEAMPRLTGAGAPIDVGPDHILEAFGALARDGAINLNGTTTRLDFDPATGDVDTDIPIVCMRADRDGRAIDEVESGLFFDTRTKQLEGALRCP